MITFAVSEVLRCEQARPATTLEESLKVRSERLFEAAACNQTGLIQSRAHGFLEAVYLAFYWHYPLILSPDDVWLCLAQGFATHVKLHAETLRSQFVSHEGKREIIVIRDHFIRRSPTNDWPGMMAEFSDRIREHVGTKRDLVVADFSTTGAVERAVSEIVLFDALQTYFEYTVITRSGIPEITLLGTVDDWLAIRRRAAMFAEFDLTDWTASLLPVLDKIVQTARGDVDRTFWQSFYKQNNMSGGPYVNGWINVFFPWVEKQEDGAKQREPSPNLFAMRWEEGLTSEWDGGPALHDFPTGLSSAPFMWKYLGKNIPMVFMGGFAGVSQDAATAAIRPALGWAIGEDC